MPTRRDLVAAAVLFVHVGMVVLAPPVLDYLSTSPKRTPELLEPVVALDRQLRGPVERLSEPAQALLGTRQSWHFYTTGASRTRHFEIWVDGERWHRSNHPDDDFLAGPFANSRLRHHAKDWVRGKRLAKVEQPLMNYVVAQVLAENPEARRVELRGREGRWPGRRQRTVRKVWATAPGWLPHRETP